MTEVWKKIRAITDTSVIKLITYIEHDGELIRNPDEIDHILAARYAMTSSTSQGKMKSNTTLTSNVKDHEL